MSDLRQWTAILSGASLSKFSIRRMVKSRELGRREKLISHHASFVPNTSGAFTLDEKANLVNRSTVHLCFNLNLSLNC
ncbi:hypothetical protein X798_05331 [Onchocerca flexuosa]|uniref:Uncharacterized protein n=1 Tax=Onchocerca flexuosa TaxID=387005 RepID=A0A238BSN8_9BILA|nr:hypothetical protein X798_05331 [Onchocerca flexuosa]